MLRHQSSSKNPPGQRPAVEPSNVAATGKNTVVVSPNVSEILSSSVTGASYLVLLQLFTRLTTFALNQLLLRYTSPATLGIASVQLELLLSTVLFLSREGFRCALLRGAGVDSESEGEGSARSNSATGSKADAVTTDARKQKRKPVGAVDSTSPFSGVQKVTNLAYIPIVIGAATTLITCALYLRSPPSENGGSPPPFYATSVIFYGLAAWIELLSEPLYVLVQNGLYFQVRVAVEGTAVVVRCFTTLALTLVGASITLASEKGGDAENVYGVLSFAVAQLLFACIMSTGYAGFWLKKIREGNKDRSTKGIYDAEDYRSLLPRPIWNEKTKTTYYFDKQILGLATTFTKQSLLKHLLTEGDKMLISKFCSAHDQGVYAFVVNYGCLVVRILFQPLEETGRMMFTKLLSPLNAPTPDSRGTGTDSKVAPSLPNESHTLLKTSAELLGTLMKFHILLGFHFIAFGSNYTGTAIDLLVGSKWSTGTSAPLTLSVYCLYVPIMGINGITEAFVQAVARESDLKQLSKAMIGFSAIFMVAGYVFMSVLNGGAIGLVIATAVNLTIRIAWSLRFIRKYFGSERWGPGPAKEYLEQIGWDKVFPSISVCVAFAGSWIVTRWSESTIGWKTMEQKMLHIAVGVGCFAIASAVTVFQERSFLQQITKIARSKKQE